MDRVALGNTIILFVLIAIFVYSSKKSKQERKEAIETTIKRLHKAKENGDKREEAFNQDMLEQLARGND